MTYLYADYASQSSTAERLRVLRLHQAEVAQTVGGQPDVAADGKSVSFATTAQYLDFLAKQERWYMSLPDAPGARRGGRSLAQVRRG